MEELDNELNPTEKRGRGRPKGSLGKNNLAMPKREMDRFIKGMISRDNLEMSKEDNARYTAHSMEIANLPIINMLEPGQVRERVNLYFKLCQEHDLKPNLAGLSLSLHMDRRELLQVCNHQRKAPEEVIDIIMQARRLLNDLMETYQYDNKIQAVPAIFLSKNNFGYTDQTEVVIANSGQFSDVQDAAEIRNKYLNNIVDDSIDEQ